MSNHPPATFRLKGLGQRYLGAAEPSLVGVSAELPAGETIAVLGPSGSGKSTLLSLLGLLWDGTGPEGGLWFNDGRQEYDLLHLDRSTQTALRASAFGFVLQSSYMLPHFTCLENLAMPLAMQGWPAPDRARWASALLEAVRQDQPGAGSPGLSVVDDLDAKRNQPPREASFGQRQRFAVLRALIADPSVVFADEPSSSLDPGRSSAMFDLLDSWKAGQLFRAIREDFAGSRQTSPIVRDWLTRTGGGRTPRTLILVCHDVPTARREADRFLLLNSSHTLEANFRRCEWDQYATTVEAILGLRPGDAGRDDS